MERYSKTNCIHIENDYLIYFSTNDLPDMENKIWLTMDSSDRCVPGILYIPSAELLKPLITNYDYTINDMYNLGKFYNDNKSICNRFPMMPDEPFFDQFEMIFDAAAIGQYLGGIDPIHAKGNVPGFINELFHINFSEYQFYWKRERWNYIPVIKMKDHSIHKIGGIHVHSKNLQNFLSDQPIENRLIKLSSNTFITFGSADYNDAKKRISVQVKQAGEFDFIHAFGESDLQSDPEFWNLHSEFIKNNPRGYGYWIWKPYLILKTLYKMNENDILLYADCGCEIVKKDRLKDLFEQTQKYDIVSSYASMENLNTKRDLFQLMDSSGFNVSSLVTKSLQFQASAICLKRCKKVYNLVSEWYKLACDYHNIDDSPSALAEYPQFIEHRHDQSIFSLLMKREYLKPGRPVLSTVVDIVRNRTGISQFKVSQDDFDWKQYLLNYPELTNLGTPKKAYQHYIKYGKKENRTFYPL